MLRERGLRVCGTAKLCLVLAGVSGLALLGCSPPAAAQGMAVSGKFEVEPTGAASYTIPIAVPPGTAGMTPSISLAYNSLSRNGVVGMGWALEGLPAIGRCPRTMAQDGARGLVKYDADDRFCMDGQRLMAVGGTYGADGTEYRTEIESFSKVVSRGTAGTGPAWFEVRSKSGQRMEFGNSADSRVLAQGKTAARDWMVSKVADTRGNYFTITYVNDTTNGQVYPSRIDYTANDAVGLAAYNSVRFVYDTGRPDVVPGYHAGSLQKTTVRLTNVQAYAGANLVTDYRLAYQQGSTTGRSQLKSVTVCDGAGACLPPTTFAWQNGTVTPTVISNPGGLNGTVANYRAYLGDFNGDGMADVLWDQQPSGALWTSGTRVLWTSTGAGGFSVNGNLGGLNGTLLGYSAFVADFNRDGKADIFWSRKDTETNARQNTQWLSTPGGTFATFASAFPDTYAAVSDFSGVDVNRDLRSDLFQVNSAFVDLRTANSDGTFGNTAVTVNACGGSGYCSFNAFPADFNGDGATDIMWLRTNSTQFDLRLNDGTGNFVYTSGATDNAMNGFAPYFIDVNGDNKTDILWSKTTQRILWISKEDGTFDKQSNVSGQDGTLSGFVPYAGDFNGDGLNDLLWVKQSTGTRVLWQGKGDGTFTVLSNFAGQDGQLVNYTPILADFNGDGKTDILWDQQYGANDPRSKGTRVLWLSDGVAADLVTSITTGVGSTIGITYKSMTDTSVYTKDMSPVDDPVIHIQGSQFVVSRVDASNGIGGLSSTGYTYAGARAHIDGRGFLGFRQMITTDLQTSIVRAIEYQQEFPFVGLVASETSKLGSVTLGQTSNIYGWTSLGGTRFQTFLAQSQVQRKDIDGSALPTAASTYQHDSYGNATQIVVATTDGFQKTTTNTYSNDTTNWLLGRLTRASVASLKTEPGQLPPQEPTNVTISSSTSNLNLWSHLLSNGYTSSSGSWVVTIASGVTISSVSTLLPALDTGAFPLGSTLKIVNNGTIAGAGGKGGNGPFTACDAWGENCVMTPWSAAASGGPALRARVPVTVVNNYRIWGGGGGGGGGQNSDGMQTGGGGGGGGVVAGKGGKDTYPGADGTATAGGKGGAFSIKGGDGGSPGLSGAQGACDYSCNLANGGSPGPATIGNSFITWVTTGDRKGPIN